MPKHGSILVEISQFCSNWTKARQHRTNIGRTWPNLKFGRGWPKLGKIWPKSVPCCSTLAQIWSVSGDARIRAQFARATSGRRFLWPACVERGCCSNWCHPMQPERSFVGLLMRLRFLQLCTLEAKKKETGQQVSILKMQLVLRRLTLQKKKTWT